jgi:hypothetical protein
MKAAVAVQRKLLEMVYTVYKSKTVYDKNYLSENKLEQFDIKENQATDIKN